MMNRYEKIAYLVSKKTKKHSTLFDIVFDKFKLEVKKYEKQKADDALSELKSKINNDLKKYGFKFEIDLSLGKFRGHYYVTSAKIFIINKLSDDKINKLLTYMIDNYSSKFKYKGIEDNKYKFSIR